MKLLILGFCVLAAACSDASVERSRPSGGSNTLQIETVSNTAMVEVTKDAEEQLANVSVAAATVEQVETIVQNADVVIKEEVKKAEETSKRVCFGPNNTDCVEVQVRPKFEGTAVPQK